ncbi:MAG: hypothetical protein ABWZ26_04730 [Candidatus Nanopelagicales bacterium]
MIVARGRYLYRLDGTRHPLTESFEISMHDGLVTVFGVRRSDPDDLVLEASASYGVQSLIHAELTMSAGAGTTRRASYELLGDEVVVRRGRHSQAVFVPEDAEVFPLLRVFQGRVVARALAAGEAGLTVVTPDIRAGTSGPELLVPVVDVCAARAQADGTLELRGGMSEPGPAIVWLEEGGLLRSMTWVDASGGSWEVELAEIDGSVRPLEW